MGEPSNIGFLLKQINDKMRQMVDKELHPFDLTLTQVRFLAFLRSRLQKDTSVRDFEDHFDIAHTTVLGVLKRLEQKSLVTFVTDPNDGRRKLVTLAPAEAQIHRQVMAAKQRIETRLTQHMTPHDRMQLEATLRRLHTNLLEPDDK